MKTENKNLIDLHCHHKLGRALKTEKIKLPCPLWMSYPFLLLSYFCLLILNLDWESTLITLCATLCVTEPGVHSYQMACWSLSLPLKAISCLCRLGWVFAFVLSFVFAEALLPERDVLLYLVLPHDCMSSAGFYVLKYTHLQSQPVHDDCIYGDITWCYLPAQNYSIAVWPPADVPVLNRAECHLVALPLLLTGKVFLEIVKTKKISRSGSM